MDNNLPLIVFDLHDAGSIEKIINGEEIGSRIEN